jgi:hypothetical protein
MRDFALEVHFSKWEFKARYNLTGSDAESMSVSELLALARTMTGTPSKTSTLVTPKRTDHRRCAKRSPALMT